MRAISQCGRLVCPSDIQSALHRGRRVVGQGAALEADYAAASRQSLWLTLAPKTNEVGALSPTSICGPLLLDFVVLDQARRHVVGLVIGVRAAIDDDEAWWTRGSGKPRVGRVLKWPDKHRRAAIEVGVAVPTLPYLEP